MTATRQYVRLVFLLVFLVVSVNCEEATDSICRESSKVIDVGQESHSFLTSLDTVVVETNPSYIVDRDNLEDSCYCFFEINGRFYPGYPEPIDECVSHEFVINPGDSFQVGILNCRIGISWTMELDVDNVSLVEQYAVQTSLELYDIFYTFDSMGGGKGYIGFAELDTSQFWCGPGGSCVSPDSKCLIVAYTAGVIEDMYINLDTIVWKYDLEGPSELSILLQGTTNAYRLKIETYGDGVIWNHDMQIQSDSTFNDEVSIAFSHLPNVYKKNNTKLGIYGTVGPPKFVVLKNPLK